MRLDDTKTGPRTIRLGPEAARLLKALPQKEGAARVFPEDLTSARLYTFWVGIRGEAGLPGLCIHDYRHTWASQGAMNGVGLITVGRLLGHRRRETTAIYAHLDDGALRDAAAAGRGETPGDIGRRARVLNHRRAVCRARGEANSPLGQTQGNRADGWHRVGR